MIARWHAQNNTRPQYLFRCHENGLCDRRRHCGQPRVGTHRRGHAGGKVSLDPLDDRPLHRPTGESHRREASLLRWRVVRRSPAVTLLSGFIPPASFLQAQRKRLVARNGFRSITFLGKSTLASILRNKTFEPGVSVMQNQHNSSQEERPYDNRVKAYRSFTTEHVFPKYSQERQ